MKNLNFEGIVDRDPLVNWRAEQKTRKIYFASRLSKLGINYIYDVKYFNDILRNNIISTCFHCGWRL